MNLLKRKVLFTPFTMFHIKNGSHFENVSIFDSHPKLSDMKNNYNEKIILFAHPRSGSTSLIKILNTHPSLNIAHEPFHENYNLWNPNERKYIDLVKNISTLEIAFAELFRKYNGIKLLHYQLPRILNNYLLSLEEYKIIFLRRENLLQSVISNLIAEQTTAWHKEDLNIKTKKLYNNLNPIPISTIQERLKFDKEWMSYYEKRVKNRRINTLSVTYEELYASDMKQRTEEQNKIFNFLELEMPNEDKIAPYLTPGQAKMNSTKEYKLIPNIDEIISIFQNEANGHLI